MNNTIQAVTMVRFPVFRSDSQSELLVMQGGERVPFEISRVFVVRANDGVLRGLHAHRECSQLLCCLSGSVNVTVDDGTATATFPLCSPSDSLLIPPGIWARQDYTADDSVLMVLCDLPYDESDYVRDYDEFLLARGLA